jgi:hypothetical protein
VPFFAHFDFLQCPCQSFILPSYAEASTFVLADLCSIPPSPEPRIRYHPNVEIFIDHEAREASVQDIFGLFLPLIVLCLYLIET